LITISREQPAPSTSGQSRRVFNDAGRSPFRRTTGLAGHPSGNVSGYTPIKKQSDIRFATSFPGLSRRGSSASPKARRSSWAGQEGRPDLAERNATDPVGPAWNGHDDQRRGDNSPNTYRNDRVLEVDDREAKLGWEMIVMAARKCAVWYKSFARMMPVDDGVLCGQRIAVAGSVAGSPASPRLLPGAIALPRFVR
jgi:hypothetical protein